MIIYLAEYKQRRFGTTDFDSRMNNDRDEIHAQNPLSVLLSAKSDGNGGYSYFADTGEGRIYDGRRLRDIAERMAGNDYLHSNEITVEPGLALIRVRGRLREIKGIGSADEEDTDILQRLIPIYRDMHLRRKREWLGGLEKTQLETAETATSEVLHTRSIR
jgi:hypothetical protein